jgi:hypothetical protein
LPYGSAFMKINGALSRKKSFAVLCYGIDLLALGDNQNPQRTSFTMPTSRCPYHAFGCH